MRGQAGEYRIDLTSIEVGNVERLSEIISKRMAEAAATGADEKSFFVRIRADRRVNYGQVEPVIRAAVQADVAKMNISTLLGQ